MAVCQVPKEGQGLVFKLSQGKQLKQPQQKDSWL